jgi:hypothetical protein
MTATSGWSDRTTQMSSVRLLEERTEVHNYILDCVLTQLSPKGVEVISRAQGPGRKNDIGTHVCA